jgi:hypothetical protein
VYGRFSVHRHTPISRVAAIASGRRFALLREAVVWNLKKVLKVTGGNTYLKLRRLILNSHHRCL